MFRYIIIIIYEVTTQKEPPLTSVTLMYRGLKYTNR